MNVIKYLHKLDIDSISSPDIENLKKLHRQHMYNIPFENLDIHSGKKIILDPDKVESKILGNNRGGYCYELNGLFSILLKECGYETKMISARVNNGKGGWGDEYDHLAILVQIDNSIFLADVGFGNSFLEPLKFETDLVQRDETAFYKISKYKDGYFLLEKSTDSVEFTGEYIFSTIPRDWKEFEDMNEFHQNSADSHFTRKKVCTLPSAEGRITLSSDKLTFTELLDGSKREISAVNDEKHFSELLLMYFKIKL